MNFNFKKIASVASSTLLIGSTVALAAAANYPAPFVSGGNADVAIVTGANAAPTDFTAAQADILSQLTTIFAQQGGTTTTTTTTNSSSGDSIKLAKPNNNVNMGDTVSGVFGATISDDDLPELLSDGVYKNDQNDEFEFEQKVTLGNALQLNYFSDSDYQDRMPSVGINLTSPQSVLNYTLDFTTDAESDVSSSGRLTDLETTTIHMLGRDYYIQRAENGTTPKITLLDAANSATAREGEPTTVTVGGRTYTVSIEYIDTSQVKLNVNGESTNTLEEGETYRLTDGSYVSVKDILARDIQGAIGQVDFGIGSGKIELTNGAALKLNDDSITEITPFITLSYSGSSRSLDKIVLQWMTDDDEFVTPEQKLVMPGFGALELSMTNFVMPAEEMTTIESGSNTEMDIQTTIKDGDVEIPFLFSNGSGFTGIGKDASSRLVTSASTTEVFFNETRGDEWMIASFNDSNSAESYLLHFDFTTDNGINRTTISKRSNGAWSDVCRDKQPGDSCTLGSLQLTVSQVVRSGSQKWASVNMTSTPGSFRDVYTAEGLKIRLPVDSVQAGTGNINLTVAPSTFVLPFFDEDKNDNIAQGGTFNVTMGHQSDGDVEVTTLTTGRTVLTDPDESNHQLSHVYDDLSPLVERVGESSDQRYAQITYPGGESYGEVYLNAPGAVSVGGNGGTLGGVTVTDAQVDTVSGKNLIVVGGSCINSVAARVLGSSTPVCGAEFTSMSGGIGSGQFLIQAYSSPYSSSKVALLVAGYEAQDTINAAKYLTTQTVDTTVGKRYVGTSATQATLVTTGA